MIRARRGDAAVPVFLGVGLALGFLTMGPGAASAQGLADFDYENLSFQGAMLDVGYVFSGRVDNTTSFGGRVDLGLLGPGVRVVAGFNRWSSFLTHREVQSLEASVSELILDQTGEVVAVDLGDIRWSDVSLYADAHFLWEVPFGVLTYLGAGAGGHILRGGGPAIDGTFVNDLLDSVRAGANLHGGLEIPVQSRLRLVGEARYELVEDLSYFQIRTGIQFVFGG
ncbi:MAG: hypothetical protein WD056_00425 [Gemmatimonadota bacterium]